MGKKDKEAEEIYSQFQQNQKEKELLEKQKEELETKILLKKDKN